MAFNMTLWENRDGQLAELPRHRLDQEERLEEWVAKDPSLLGMDVLLIGRQVKTPYAGRIDLLGIDPEGDLVVFELKRDRTPREVVAQVLDYGAWASELLPGQVADIAQKYLGRPLAEAFHERFEADLPEVVNNDHRLVIVASELDDSSERIVHYLSARHSLNINVVYFTCFRQDGKELVGRAWLLDPEEVEERSEVRRTTPWSGFWFANVGEGPHRNWDDCRKYGFLTAGGGSVYSGPVRKLAPGSKVFAYLKGRGYVGFGEVIKAACPAKDFVPEGQAARLLDLPLTEPGIGHEPDDPEKCDWVAAVRWEKAVDRDDARRFPKMFAVPNVVCKLRNQPTVEFLRREFGITD